MHQEKHKLLLYFEHCKLLQEAGRDLKAAQSLVSAKRRAFPRNAPGSHAAAVQALEQMRQNNAAPETSQPQVTTYTHLHPLFPLEALNGMRLDCASCSYHASRFYSSMGRIYWHQGHWAFAPELQVSDRSSRLSWDVHV